jgi:asparagine synthase (glutamine-hydrolysing)
MAASIESRVPFLDHKVVEFAASVPGRWKTAGASGKRLVKRALARSLPESILRRKKTGFPVPFGDWLRTGLDGPLCEIALGQRAADRGLINPDFVRTLIAENQAGRRNHTEPLWTVLNLELWARIFLDGESPQDLSEQLTQRGSPRRGTTPKQPLLV